MSKINININATFVQCSNSPPTVVNSNEYELLRGSQDGNIIHVSLQ